MTLRLGLAGALLALTAACNPAAAPQGGANDSAMPSGPAPAVDPGGPEGPANAAEPGAPTNTVESPAPVELPDDSPGVADMNPWQRRAWEAGYRDCSAGRYEPAPWPEAYRIGCGAAQEREGR